MLKDLALGKLSGVAVWSEHRGVLLRFEPFFVQSEATVQSQYRTEGGGESCLENIQKRQHGIFWSTDQSNKQIMCEYSIGADQEKAKYNQIYHT